MIDFNLTNEKNLMLLGSPVDLLIQQVDMLFNTDLYAVLGDPMYGTNYDKYLYTVGISNAALESKILSDINKLDLLGFTPSVEVQLIHGSERDIALIDITFSGEYDTYHKTYVIK